MTTFLRWLRNGTRLSLRPGTIVLSRTLWPIHASMHDDCLVYSVVPYMVAACESGATRLANMYLTDVAVVEANRLTPECRPPHLLDFLTDTCRGAITRSQFFAEDLIDSINSLDETWEMRAIKPVLFGNAQLAWHQCENGFGDDAWHGPWHKNLGFKVCDVRAGLKSVFNGDADWRVVSASEVYGVFIRRGLVTEPIGIPLGVLIVKWMSLTKVVFVHHCC